MGFIDKVKGRGKELKEKVEDKVEDVQGKRRAAALLEELGRFLYSERTGRSLGEGEADISRIVGELQKLEQDGVAILPEP